MTHFEKKTKVWNTHGRLYYENKFFFAILTYLGLSLRGQTSL